VESLDITVHSFAVALKHRRQFRDGTRFLPCHLAETDTFGGDVRQHLIRSGESDALFRGDVLLTVQFAGTRQFLFSQFSKALCTDSVFMPSPSGLHFVEETTQGALIAKEGHWLHASHPMTFIVTVSVVVTEHPAVVVLAID
jgi:hypothetical protein